MHCHRRLERKGTKWSNSIVTGHASDHHVWKEKAGQTYGKRKQVTQPLAQMTGIHYSYKERLVRKDGKRRRSGGAAAA